MSSYIALFDNFTQMKVCDSTVGNALPYMVTFELGLVTALPLWENIYSVLLFGLRLRIFSSKHSEMKQIMEIP